MSERIVNTKWRQIWEKRSINEAVLKQSDPEELFIELKRANGFDVVNGGIPFSSLMEQYELTKKLLLECAPKAASVYEVGCGSGANLLLFSHDGWQVGGVDYSAALIETAKKVLPSEDLLYAPASEMPETPAYDCLLSNSVFSYFTDYAYAEAVLQKMCKKARYAIALIDIHDIEKKDAFIAFRKEEIKDYEERYRDLPKLFYSKEFFVRFAEENGLKLRFVEHQMEGYWNSQFVFHLVLSKPAE